MEPLEWVFVSTFLVLVFIVFAVNPLQAAIGEAIQNNAQLQSQRLASAINLVQSAPEGTTYVFDMPKTKCNITVTGGLVRLTIMPATGGDISYTTSMIKTPVVINAGSGFTCSSRNNLQLRKRSGAVEISTS